MRVLHQRSTLCVDLVPPRARDGREAKVNRCKWALTTVNRIHAFTWGYSDFPWSSVTPQSSPQVSGSNPEGRTLFLVRGHFWESDRRPEVPYGREQREE